MEGFGPSRRSLDSRPSLRLLFCESKSAEPFPSRKILRVGRNNAPDDLCLRGGAGALMIFCSVSSGVSSFWSLLAEARLLLFASSPESSNASCRCRSEMKSSSSRVTELFDTDISQLTSKVEHRNEND